MPNQIDLPRAAFLWTEVERTLYNQLPIYMAERQVEYIQMYDKWGKLLRPQKWSPNMGNIMKGVNKVKSPVLRGQFLPNVITTMPRKDVVEVRETGEQVQLYRHDLDSNIFQFLPSFQDFLTNHVDAHEEDMTEKGMVLKDLFYRTAIFHGSPVVYICGATPGLVSAPYWKSPNIALSKTQAWIQSIIPQVIAPLTLEHTKRLGTIMYTDLAVQPYTGKVLPDGTDGSGLKQKYCLMTSTEVWDSFTDTGTYLLANKKLDLDIVTGPFTGSLFSRWTSMFERFEMRIAEDGTIPAPETTQENPDEYNFGEPVPNPIWVNAPIGVAFGIGYEPYKAINVGAPPSLFANGGGGGMTMAKFNGMDWSGKITHTRNVLVNSLDQSGAVVLDTNKRGEYLQLVSDLAMGILPNQRRAVVPILYLRTRQAV